MDKNLRKSYECLDLPITASVEQVEAREKALIKILQAKEKISRLTDTRQKCRQARYENTNQRIFQPFHSLLCRLFCTALSL